tara:strand:+ start:225 stop:473 length:249 start_codon:yes stop_codon:yes gene_type:complete
MKNYQTANAKIKLNQVTKLVVQASFIKKQMIYGMKDFHLINDLVHDKMMEALSINKTINHIPTMLEGSKRINSVHQIEIKNK